MWCENERSAGYQYWPCVKYIRSITLYTIACITDVIQPRLVMKQLWNACSRSAMDSTNYLKCVSNFLSTWWPYWQWLFNRPIMARTQILVHRWGLEQGFQHCFADGLNHSLQKIDSCSFVCGAGYSCMYTTALWQLCENIILCTLRSCSTTLRKLCWRMSFFIPANICYCSIIKYCSKVSFQLLLISCGWELHHMLRNSHRMLWESHSARII